MKYRLSHLFYLLPLLFALNPAYAGVQIQHWVHQSGMRAYLVETHNLPMLDIKIDCAAGSIFDPPNKKGVASLTASLLDLGAGEMNETEISSALADVGARLATGASADLSSITLRTLSASDKQEPALKILRTVLQAPQFDKKVFERERGRSISALKDALTRPATLASRAFWSALYPEHPYGALSTAEGISNIQLEDLRAFYKRHYAANNCIVTLVGDIKRSKAEKIVQQLAQKLPTQQQPQNLPNPPKTTKKQTSEITHSAKQAHILMGLPAIAKGNPDYFALIVGNYTLGGGGFVSRLMAEVREKRGLVYSIHSYFTTLRQPGPFLISLQTKKAQAQDALKVVRKVLNDFLIQGPTKAELAAAKSNIIGSFPLGLDSNAKLLRNVSSIAFYGLPLDYLDTFQDKVRQVSLKDIKQAFARHVDPSRMITVIVGGN